MNLIKKHKPLVRLAGSDSGSLVLYMDNRPAGLLLARFDKTIIMSDIQQVMDALEIEFLEANNESRQKE